MPVSLAERLRERIQREGPITFRDWMQAALYDPDEGYYQRFDLKRWGREGDYRTSPERSELFASTFAGYFAKLYDQLGRPEDWTIVECGAGDGRFAEGVLRSFAAARYVVCDASTDALQRARERLREFEGRVEFRSELPQVERGVFFSNELFDAFPVHRVTKTREGLAELYVTADLDWTTGALSTEALAEFCETYAPELAPGQTIEVNLAIDAWLSQVAAKLSQGFVITVDYGEESRDLYNNLRRPQGSLRAFSQHGFVDSVLDQPGAYDITSTINWTHVKSVGEKLGFNVVQFSSQDKFLLNEGLLDVLERRLTGIQSERERLSLTSGAREMILPGGMASSFQVLVQQRV